MRKILLIGGAGFIGKQLAQNFKFHEDYVDVYDINETSVGNNNYVGNILDDYNFDHLIKNYDVIVYLAEQMSLQDTDIAIFNKEIKCLEKTLESAYKHNIKRVILASSGTVYKDIGRISREEDPLEPYTYYGICKLVQERLLLLYNQKYNMENVILRISNVYGKKEETKTKKSVITEFIYQLKNNKPITIYGDGSTIRDYVNILEVTEAIYQASIYEMCKLTPIFNIGSGKGLSVNYIVQLIVKTLRIKPDIKFRDKRPYDIDTNALDITKAKKYLGYCPDSNEIFDIREYIKEYYKE